MGRLLLHGGQPEGVDGAREVEGIRPGRLHGDRRQRLLRARGSGRRPFREPERLRLSLRAGEVSPGCDLWTSARAILELADKPAHRCRRPRPPAGCWLQRSHPLYGSWTSEFTSSTVEIGQTLAPSDD